MKPLTSAKAHLAKAEEFLEAARRSSDRGLHDAAASNAVTAGINAKDAICFKLTGRSERSDDHAAATGELKRSGQRGAGLAPSLQRLLSQKAKAQYRSTRVSSGDAQRSVELAARLCESARGIVTS